MRAWSACHVTKIYILHNKKVKILVLYNIFTSRVSSPPHSALKDSVTSSCSHVTGDADGPAHPPPTVSRPLGDTEPSRLRTLRP